MPAAPDWETAPLGDPPGREPPGDGIETDDEEDDEEEEAEDEEELEEDGDIGRSCSTGSDVTSTGSSEKWEN